MDPTSFGLAVIAEARTLATSIKNRVGNYRKGPETFQTVSDNVDRLARHIGEVEKLLRTFPSAVPVEISIIFDETFAAVRRSLEDANQTTERSFSKAFTGSSGSAIAVLRSKAYRTFQATALISEMNVVETKIEKAANQLLQLTLALGNSLKMQEHQGVPVRQIEKLLDVESFAGAYRCASNAPAHTDAINLNFDAKDEKGEPATPEGRLKLSVMSSNSSRTVTAAAGVMNCAFGIVGMAGVGKTVALQGLAHDKDIRNRFPDGIFFMTLGQSATVRTVLGELMKILTIAGASAIAGAVQKSSSLQDAIDYAALWFEHRSCLFLVDDVWPTKNCKAGFLTSLRQLLRDSPDSRMAVTTRIFAIAQYAGSLVSFGARDPLGPTSENIFMAHAAGGASQAVWHGKRPDSVTNILSMCCGLPIALSVTGSAVAFLANVHGGFERACEGYSKELEKKRGGLGDQDTLDGVSLNARILLSLEYLEYEFLKLNKCSFFLEHSVIELYTSLCVLENKGWISISVLSRLWHLDAGSSKAVAELFCGMSLATLEWRPSGSASSLEAGIILHDLLLDFCRQEAEKANTSAIWHRQLLNGYIEQSGGQECVYGALSAKLILRCTPRPWWSKADDGYIHKNLTRHLSCSSQNIELAALLLDARWTKLRWKIGGILALKSDFHYLGLCFKEWEILEEPETHTVGNGKGFRQVVKAVQNSLGRISSEKQERQVKQSFKQIFKAVRLSWGRMSDGLRAFQFNVCGRLASLRKSSAIVDTYLSSVESSTPKPYLTPVNSFFPGIDSSQRMEIRVGDSCGSVACSPCGRFIAARVRNGVVVVELASGDLLQTMEAQTGHVHCVTFAAGSKNVVSGCADGAVVVWEWESSDSHVNVLEGHTARVTGVAVSSDGNRIFSISDDRTLRIWDSSTGAQKGKMTLNRPANCIAICAENRRVALGFGRGAWKVLDGYSQKVIFEDDKAHSELVQCVSFSPNGLYLATGSFDGKVCVWNTYTWKRNKEQLNGHKNGVLDVAFSPDGKYIASFSCAGTLRLWDVAFEKYVGMIPELPSGFGSISFSPDGGSIILGCFDGFVRIWDSRLDSIPLIDTVEAMSVSMSLNGQRAALLLTGGTMQVWDLQRGKLISVLIQQKAHNASCISLSPDGRQIVSRGTCSAPTLWDAKRGTQLGHPFEGNSSILQCVSFSADGRRLVSGYWDGSICIWDVRKRKQIGDLLEGHEHRIVCVSETSDGRYIVSRDSAKKTFIWNWRDGTIVWKSRTDGSHLGDVLRKNSSCFDNENTEEHRILESSITEDEAEKIIRNCGEETPYLWPECLCKYSSEVYVEGNLLCSNLLGGRTVIGNLPGHRKWRYNVESNFLVACLDTGSIAICKMIL